MARPIKRILAALFLMSGVAAFAQQSLAPSSAPGDLRTPPPIVAQLAQISGLSTAGTSNAPGNPSDRAPSTGKPASDEPSPRLLVERADEIRFPKDGFQVDVIVRSTTGGESQEPRRYRIYSKGAENSVIQTLEPQTERGQNLLMRGRDLWIFMPTVSQPVRLSLAQRLTGVVANGDLARASFAADYEPRILRTEKIDGREHYVLELTATERAVTYTMIRYWVRASDNFPHKAEFYALSGRMLKTCLYERFQPLAGRVRPTRLVITDALKPGDVSVLEYAGLRPRDIPDRMFTKDYLKKLD